MKKVLGAASIALLALIVPAQAMTMSVWSDDQSLTDLGAFGPGNYNITATGVVDLGGAAVGSGYFDIAPDGMPVSTVKAIGYSYFNPDGATYDIQPNNYGPAGSAFKLGALIGSLTATPTLSDFFLIGYGTTLHLTSSEHIYAFVNDTYYCNNIGAYSVTVTTAVPEPSTWVLMIAGFVGLAAMAARGRAKQLAAVG